MDRQRPIEDQAGRLEDPFIHIESESREFGFQTHSRAECPDEDLTLVFGQTTTLFLTFQHFCVTYIVGGICKFEFIFLNLDFY